MNRFFEAGRRMAEATRRFVRDTKRGYTDVDIAETREILAGQINDDHRTSYIQRRALLFSGFHQPPIRTPLSEYLSIVSPEDVQREIAEIRRIQNLPAEELRKELIHDARARAIRFGLTTN
ncbi:hypothetical protein HYS97_01705 [Candidatus Daviesbacteria bacterium]|nr:hypothetical protein [Candidatus Daviesbacteria bacterium]